MSEPQSPEVAEVIQAKSVLRAQLLAARRTLTEQLGPDGRAELAERIAAGGMDWLSRYAEATGPPGAPRGWTVTAYESRRTEPPVDRLVAALRAAQVRVLLPITLPAGKLQWHDASDGSAARPLGEDVLTEVDVAFTPGLAVDRRGARLGKGGGYYDRALTRLRDGTPTVTVLYESELLETVPDLPHDTRVWATLTGAGVTRIDTGPQG